VTSCFALSVQNTKQFYKLNQTDTYSAATFLVNAAIPILIAAEHAIAHNKVMVIDGTTVVLSRSCSA
jgi:phosphatidylserine/phosphatidylglycerophosphate/cardiolipin synthase-like enzyme